MNEIEEIKQRLDLVDLMSQYLTIKKAGANYKAVCPFHQEKTPSLMINPQKQIWRCFGCGKSGDHFTFIMEMEHLEFGDALRLLAQKAGVTLQPRTKAEHQTQGRKEQLFKVNKVAAAVFAKLLRESQVGKVARNYLTKRGLTDESIKKFQLGFASRNFPWAQVMAQNQLTSGDLATAGHPEKFFDRLMFPIFDVLDNVIAFTGRTLTEQQPKYLNSPETPLFNKSRVLYGLNFAKGAIKDKKGVVLVEGQMDVIALHQLGVDNVVASSGTAITETQILTLSKYTDNFLLAFDNDGAGIQATKKVIELLLKNDLNVKIVDFGIRKDAGELLTEQKPTEIWLELAKNAQEAVEWWLNQEIKQLGEPKFIETKKALAKAMLPVLSLINEPARVDQYVGQLSRLLEAKPESLYEGLKKLRQPSLANNVNHVNAAPTLTNEEQLLAILLYEPKLLRTYGEQLNTFNWQSVETKQVVEAIQTCYDEKTLTQSPTVFTQRVKTLLNSPLAGKIDAWLFWLSSSWENLSPEFLGGLAKEKFAQLAQGSYEQAKEKLASAIRQAQQSSDIAKVKSLLQELNQLTKQGV